MSSPWKKVVLGEGKIPRICARLERMVIPAWTHKMWGQGWNIHWMLKGSCEGLLSALFLVLTLKKAKMGERSTKDIKCVFVR